MVLAVLHDLPFEFDFPFNVRSDRDSLFSSLWYRLLNVDHPINTSASSRKSLDDCTRAYIARRVLRLCRHRQLQLFLRDMRDEKGRELFSLTDKTTKEGINSILLFCGRYDIDWNEKPIHMSDNSILLRALDHNANAQFKAHFSTFARRSSAVANLSTVDACLTIDQLQECLHSMGRYSRSAESQQRFSMDLRRVFQSERSQVTYGDFEDFCRQTI